MKKQFLLRTIFTVLLLFSLHQKVQASDLERKSILILNSYHSGFQWTDDQTKGILDSLSNTNVNYNISIEYMDWKRYPTEENLNNLYQRLKFKYATQQIDIILCTDDAAYSFALKHRQEIFSDAPIVFSGVNKKGVQVGNNDRNYTGVLEEIDPENTIKTALTINPSIKNIYLIYDNTESGLSTGQMCIDAAHKIDPLLKIFSLNTRSSTDIIALLSQIDQNSMILITTYFMDLDKTSINHQIFCEQISKASPVPVYHSYDFGLGNGIFGGSLATGKQQGEDAGNLAIRILNGEEADSIPIIDHKHNQYIFDYEAFEKYHISKELLPSDSNIIHKPFSFFETYHTMVITVLIIFVLLITYTIILLFYIKKITAVKLGLSESNKELTQLHEELSATEEELRAQVCEITQAHEQLEDYSTKLHHLAYHDMLTELHNRLYLYEEVGEKLNNSLHSGALYFFDIDNFKFVNDALGHNIGDELLKVISNRILPLVSENINLIRLGGDEFVFFVSNINNKEEAENFANKILDSFNQAFTINNNSLLIMVSIGIAMFPENGDDIDTLLRNADIAMYQVKNNGKNGYFFFNNQLKDKLMERVNLENYIKKALEQNEFQIFYQPQICIGSDEIDGVEALIRWNSPELGFLSPLKFISVAEETGYIKILGEWILRTACETMAKLNERMNSHFSISINISVIQFLQDNFVEMVIGILKKTSFSPELLELEITESVIIDSKELVTDKIKKLRDIGIKIAIDDFGTGYSSLSYLRNIPITTLKIDKIFVDDISDPSSNTEVTDTIIELGHKMNLTIVAEGVETKEQLVYLKENGCDKIQGYYYSKPLPITKLEEFIRGYK